MDFSSAALRSAIDSTAAPLSGSRLARAAILLLVAILVLGLHAPLALGQANVTGTWQTLSTQMPINPVHTALMSNGKILVVSGSGNVAEQTIFNVGVWDLATNSITTQTQSWDMFCNSMVVLPDGRPMVTGGNLQYDPFHGWNRTAVYDPATGKFSDMEDMANGRWYPTSTILGDGRLMVFSGLNATGSTDMHVEIYKVGVGWAAPSSLSWTPPLYPRMHLLPSGKVFYSGSSTQSRTFDPSNNTWSNVIATTIYGGSRTYGSSVLLPLTPANGYKPRVMIFGGGNPATKTTEIIDLSVATPAWASGPPMILERIEMNATLLPTGRILTVGGSLNDEDVTSASLQADLFDASGTNVTVGSAGSNGFARLYHSVSLLLPDATVWIAGGNPTRGSYEHNVEIYTPPYLYNSNGTLATRPSISSVNPGVIGYGTSFQVNTPDAGGISSVVLMKAGMSTHAFDMEQRMVGLNFSAGSGLLNVTGPPNGNIAPPGYYMLFIINNSGVPSVAKFVQVSKTPTDIPPTGAITSPASDITIAPGQSVTFTGTGNAPSGSITGYSWSFHGGSPAKSSLANPGAVTFSTAGTYTAVFTVTDSAGNTDQSPETRIITVANAPAPTLTTVNPNAATQGTSNLSVVLTGTNFLASPTCSFGAGITINSCTFNSTTKITASITVSGTATAGARDVKVTNTDGQSATKAGGFTVQTASNPAPTLTSAVPNSGTQGQSNLSVVLTGTNFLAAPTCSFGAGITINSCTFNSATKITASISILASAAVGARDVKVTDTDGQSATLTGGFTVQAGGGNPAPTLISAVPNSGTQGQSNLSVVLTGTNFLAAPTCSFGAGITINSCTFNSATKITASISILASATVGARDVKVTDTDGQSATLTSGFTVNPASGGGAINFGSGFTAGSMAVNGNAAISGTALALTTTSPTFQVGSAWFPTPVNIQNFTTDFNFQLTAGTSIADGFTFTLQNNATTTIGPSGGNLGFYQIPKSIGVKFDLYSNSGEGPDSTGLYLNGASPLLPAVDMTGTGIDLHSGHVFQVHMTYDGTTLTMTITDATTAANFTKAWAVDIPGTVGGTTAYAGFTGATGGFTALQKILTWTMSSTGGGGGTVATPTFNPVAGTYVGTQSVAINDTTSGATIFYTLDGTQPGTAVGGSTLQYSAPISVAATKTIKALATASGQTTSATASATYTIQVSTPIFSPVGGNYSGTQSVTITDATSGSTIFYTLDGTQPGTAVGGSTFQYSAPISVSSTKTIKALATAPGLTTSATASATYTIQTQVVATPTFSPVGGTYLGTQSVTISDATSGSSIFYTLDGTQPGTAVGGSTFQYTAPISVTSTTTIKALATASGLTTSATASATYTIQSQVATPTFSPVAGTYTSAQTVTISSTTTGASIFYTTNGSTPTSSSTVYSGPITVSVSETVKALATKAGFFDSNVGAATYVINTGGGGGAISLGSGFPAGSMVVNGGASIGSNALVVTTTATGQSSSAWYPTAVNIQNFTTDFTFQDSAGTSTADGMTFTLQNNNTAAIGPSGGNLGFYQIPKSVGIKFDLYSNAGEGPDSTGMYLNGASPLNPSVDMTGSGVDLHSGHVFQVHITYDGANLAMTITDSTTAASFTHTWAVDIPGTVGGTTAFAGFTGSTGGFTASQKILTWTMSSSAGGSAVATPTFSPVGGSYPSAQSVTISTTTPSATIYYTTNGTTPTTSSTVYSAPINVAATETLKAMAAKSGLANSGVATAAYTIGGVTQINYSSGFTAGNLTLNGTASLNGTRLLVTDIDPTYAISTAWYNSPINVQKFTTDFTFQITQAQADGLTFAIQGNGPTAMGNYGGGLGYGSDTLGQPGMPNSVCVKFDIFDNYGEGTNSTGLYTGGASPTIPATTIGGGVSLLSGDVMAVHIVYDGTTLTMKITDTTNTALTFTTSWTVNIPAAVNSNTAYVGFTGGTGGLTAKQEVINWTYTVN